MNLKVVGMLALGLLVVASPVVAGVKLATFTGILDDGFDLTGIFGAPGGDLTGAFYVATYTYVPGLGGHQYILPGAYEDEFGGHYDGSSNPVLSATLTINGVSVAIAPEWYGEAETTIDPYVHYTGERYSDNGIDLRDITIENTDSAIGAPASLSDNISTTTAFDPRFTYGFGYFQIIDYNYAISDYTVLTYGDMDAVGTYSVRDIPEPAMWTLLLAGFFGLALSRGCSRAQGSQLSAAYALIQVPQKVR